MKKYLIADAHCDTLSAIGPGGAAPEACTVTAKRLEEGHVGLQTFALFAGSKGVAGEPYKRGLSMIAAMDRVGVPFLKEDLPEEMPDTPHGILSIEGGEILEGSLARYDEFCGYGRIRLIALTWNHENQIGHPAKGGPEGGLKPFGLELLRRMDETGCLADVSHLNEAGFWDVVEHAALPPVASHSNSRAECEHVRNLKDDQIRAIIERGGFIGINFYSDFLREGGKATLDDVLRHIDHIAQMGGIGVLGMGSDFDGIDSWPEGLGDPTDFPALMELLSNHGYTNSDLEAISHGNFFRLLKKAEARAKYPKN